MVYHRNDPHAPTLPCEQCGSKNIGGAECAHCGRDGCTECFVACSKCKRPFCEGCKEHFFMGAFCDECAPEPEEEKSGCGNCGGTEFECHAAQEIEPHGEAHYEEWSECVGCGAKEPL